MHKLQKVFNEYKDKPFEWGKRDCCLFVCDCVKAMKDIDPAEKYRGLYDSELSAKKMLIELGTIEETFDSLFERTYINYAKRCDVVLYESHLGQTLGLVWSGGLLSMGPHGYGIVEEFIPIGIWSIL